jgi:excisionase family DNA binding protein
MQTGTKAMSAVPQLMAKRTKKSRQELPAPLDILLTPREVADILGLSESAVTKRIARGQIPAVRLGARGYRVKHSALQAYIEALPEV